MKKLIILTGPAGVGKNTIATEFAALVERCAIVDVDTIRQMLTKPHNAPWEGEEGKKQQILGAKNAIELAENFLEDDCDVMILDVVTNETAKRYREGSSDHGLKIVLLLPSLQTILQRNANRSPKISEQEIRELYTWQENLTDYDQKIDNSELSAKDLAQRIYSQIT